MNVNECQVYMPLHHICCIFRTSNPRACSLVRLAPESREQVVSLARRNVGKHLVATWYLIFPLAHSGVI